MPYCDNCDRFLNPNTLTATGDCPDCDEHVADPVEAAEPITTPWHFKLLVAGVCGYLGWRLVELIDWLI